MMLPLLLAVLALQAPGTLGKYGVNPVIENEAEVKEKLRNISESTPPETVLATLKAYEPSGEEIYFELTNTYFEIGRHSGVIRLRTMWDYEGENDNFWRQTFRITVRDYETDFTFIDISVLLLDENDNGPEFRDTQASRVVPEDADVDFRIMDVVVKDADTVNPFVNVTCVREEGDPTCDTFRIVKISGDSSNWNGRILLNKKLDYETRKSYSIRLLAYDGLHRVPQEFQIIVQDVNDSPPSFIRQNSHVRMEEIPAGTEIDYVEAVDSDDVAKRPIRYELLGDKDALNYFRVSKTGGNITAIRTLDYDDPTREPGKVYTLTIRAMELLSDNPEVLGNDSTTTAETTITITLQDANDNCPQWNVPRQTVTFLENVQTNTYRDILQLSDADYLDQNRKFYLRMVDPTSTFGISSYGDQAPAVVSIKVLNNKGIDYESPRKTYDLKVVAYDAGNATCSSTVDIVVELEDVNDETPEFILPSAGFFSAAVYENAAGGTSVIAVLADDKDSGLYGEDGFRFSFVNHPEQLFNIDERSGFVTVASCPTPGVKPCIDYEWERSYSLSVMVKDNQGNMPSKSANADLEIKILNVNDNRPLILGEYVRRINEGSIRTIPNLQIQAIDRDGDNITFGLVSSRDSSYWRIEPTSGEVTAKNPIRLENAVDDVFRFKVTASDGRYTTLGSVTITITDINDNFPNFTTPYREVSIPEDYGGDKFVTDVTVRDRDSPTSGNGKVDIDIQTGGDGKFTLKNFNFTNGEWLADVYTQEDATFDFDLTEQYRLILYARDKGNPPKTSSATLVVNILDVNNKNPFIEPPTVNKFVSENEPRDYLVTTISATDRDDNAVLEIYFGQNITAYDPDGQRVTDPAKYENLFRIDKTSGEVRVNAALDRDIVSIIELPLIVVDITPTPRQTGTGSLFIHILEYNDQDPQFQQSRYDLSILEERVTGTYVYTILATDEDDQIGSYQLTQNPGNLFAINLGVLTVNGRLDYEAPLDNVTLVAMAYDLGSPQRSGSTTVVIQIININDNAPVFSKVIYDVDLQEHSTRTDPLTYVHATDADRGDFGVVRYTGNSSYFEVDEFTGAVTLKAGVNLDRETTPNLVFQITAYDSPQNASVRLNTTSQVYFNLTDINDNCPIFTQGGSYNGRIIETAVLGDQVMELFARDADLGYNRSIHFRIDDSTPEGQEASRLFTIRSIGGLTADLESGRIEVKKKLRNESGIYSFTVVASDQKGENRTGDMCSTRVGVTIQVLAAVNDAPEWVRPPVRNYAIRVLESQYRGMLVYDCHARDRNSGNQGIVDYYFRSGGQLTDTTGQFHINRVTCVIRATIVYDREAVSSYVLTVVAKDRGNPSASSETVLIVNVLDVNDNDPEFPMKNGVTIPYEESVPEGALPVDVGVIVTVSATDRDSDHRNNKVYYKIVAGNDEGYFVLNRESGELRLSSRSTNGLDREKKAIYRMEVLAYNDVSDDTVIRYRRRRSTNPSITAVIITVTDANDSPPEFVSEDYYGCVPKSAPFGKSILEVKATDQDQGGARHINYTKVRESTNSYFTVDPTQGVISNARLLYNIGSYVSILRIRADDYDGRGSRRNTAETDVKIFVTDKEEHEVKVVLSLASGDVRYYVDELIRTFVNTTAKNPRHYVCVREIQDHLNEEGGYSYTTSDVYMSAVYFDRNDEKYKIYDSRTLQSIMLEQFPQYKTLHVKSVELVSDEEEEVEEDVVLAVFIIALLLLFLAIVLLILACCLIRNSKKKKIKKLRTEAHRPAEMVLHQPAPEVAASVNPMYDNNDYAVVQKRHPAPAEVAAPPIIPVVVAAAAEEEPEPIPMEVSAEPQGSEPVIITEVVPAGEEPIIQPPPEDFFPPEPEVEAAFLPPPEPEIELQEPEPMIETVIETDVDPYEEYHYPAPEQSPEEKIDVEFRDLDDSPSPRRSPSPPTPPQEEYRIETQTT